MTELFITVGERRYRVADPRRCPVAMLEHVRAVLAPTMFDAIVPFEGELAVDFIQRKCEAATEAAVPLVAAFLLPPNRTESEWTVAHASRVQRRLERLGPVVKANVHELAQVCAARLLDAVVPSGPSGPNRTIH